MSARTIEARNAVATAINSASLGFTAQAKRIPLHNIESLTSGEINCFVWVSSATLSHTDRGNRVAEISVEVGIACRSHDDTSLEDSAENAMWAVIDLLEFGRITTNSYGTVPNINCQLLAPYDTDYLRSGVFLTGGSFTFRFSV